MRNIVVLVLEERLLCIFMVGSLQQHCRLEEFLLFTQLFVRTLCWDQPFSPLLPFQHPVSELIHVKKNTFLQLVFLFPKVTTCIVNLCLEAQRSRKILDTRSQGMLGLAVRLT